MIFAWLFGRYCQVGHDVLFLCLQLSPTVRGWRWISLSANRWTYRWSRRLFRRVGLWGRLCCRDDESLLWNCNGPLFAHHRWLGLSIGCVWVLRKAQAHGRWNCQCFQSRTWCTFIFVPWERCWALVWWRCRIFLWSRSVQVLLQVSWGRWGETRRVCRALSRNLCNFEWLGCSPQQSTVLFSLNVQGEYRNPSLLLINKSPILWSSCHSRRCPASAEGRDQLGKDPISARSPHDQLLPATIRWRDCSWWSRTWALKIPWAF